MKNQFLRCGVLGWCWEILVTGLSNFGKRDFDARLMSQTSLLMFPIYGLGAFLRPFAWMVRRFPALVRGFFYAGAIFGVEYCTGMFLKKRGMCPWDYSGGRWNVNGVIRLDYAPGWILLGLIYERMLTRRN